MTTDSGTVTIPVIMIGAAFRIIVINHFGIVTAVTPHKNSAAFSGSAA
ncbi:MAG TPA: hypothetical protein VF534_30640 [Paraburkholderia sp.]